MSEKFLPKAALAAAALGLAAGAIAAPTTFQINATVQNALTVDNENDLELGTLFAVTGNSAAYKYLTLSPAGSYGAPTGSNDVILLTLGGQQAARGSVVVGYATTPIKVTLPSAALSDLVTDGLANSGSLAADQSGGSFIEVGVADPSAARFYLGDFRAGAVSNGSASANCANSHVCTITPAFSQNSVSFGIGATLMTDLRAAPYQETSYTGSFEVEASY